MPAALLGIRDNENLYVEENGAWNAKYLPAFVRRYPFVFSSDDGANFTLCLDEDFHGVNRKGWASGCSIPGRAHAISANVLNFLQAYQAQYDATRAFCSACRNSACSSRCRRSSRFAPARRSRSAVSW